MRKLILIFTVLLGLPGFIDSAAAEGKYTIAVAEIMQETNSFSPVLTTRDDFKACALLYGDEILPVARDVHFRCRWIHIAYDHDAGAAGAGGRT